MRGSVGFVRRYCIPWVRARALLRSGTHMYVASKDTHPPIMHHASTYCNSQHSPANCNRSTRRPAYRMLSSNNVVLLHSVSSREIEGQQHLTSYASIHTQTRLITCIRSARLRRSSINHVANEAEAGCIVCIYPTCSASTFSPLRHKRRLGTAAISVHDLPAQHQQCGS